MEAKGPGEGILRIGGRLFRALHPPELTRGQVLELRVVSQGSPAVLKIPHRGEEALARLLKPPAQGLGEAVQVLLSQAGAHGPGSAQSALLSAVRSLFLLPPDPEGLAHALARFVRDSGVFHEHSLARGAAADDLKGLLLRFLASGPEGELGRAAESLLGHLEAHQARGVLQQGPVVPFVLPWDDEAIPGELRFEDKPSRGEDGEPSGALRIRLEMPRLGPVEVGLRWGGAGLSVRMGLSREVLDPVRARLGELAERLAGATGVRVADLRVEALPRAEAQPGAGTVEVLA